VNAASDRFLAAGRHLQEGDEGTRSAAGTVVGALPKEFPVRTPGASVAPLAAAPGGYDPGG